MSKENRSKFYVTMKEVRHEEPPKEEMEEDDELILELARMLSEEAAQLTTVVEERVKEVRRCEAILRQIVEGRDLWINCRVNDPFPGIGCVSVIGKDLTILNMTMFRRALSLASNMDIYVDVSETIHMEFTFHGLMRR